MKLEQSKEIETALKSFAAGNLTENALGLFETLGYNTARRANFDRPSFLYFKENYFSDDTAFNEKNALVADWQSVDLLFQLSADEMSDQTAMFNAAAVDRARIESYLFFAVELKQSEYSRTALSQITRELNRVFPMPAFVLFKYDAHLTLSIINRRENLVKPERDVLEKVTLVKDINIEQPKNSQVSILFDLSFSELYRKHQFSNFVELHRAWLKTLDTKELNRSFFRELSNWYFWAIGQVEFPNGDDVAHETHRATSVIRLITRLMFVWFLKEKGLIAGELFEERALRRMLKFTDDSTFYKAVLQNLFFAALNTDPKETPRKFRGESETSWYKGNVGIHNVFRYRDQFTNAEDALERYFAQIPFLNGGLFECLDRPEDKIYIDGFSERKTNVLRVPDDLFFADFQQIDLSEIYGDKKKSKERVRGLINILDGYKFTVAENTPIEEEIALDPELLGKVFENLLANYNPETKTTARKQTGSFYTPREIVNYMVDESLIAYLKSKLQTETVGFLAAGERQTTMFGNEARVQLEFEEQISSNRWLGSGENLGAENLETALRGLFAYSEESHSFNETEIEILMRAIDECKILDPACGSGAFPMGILQRLVFLLSKLDPQNDKWKQLQIKKAQDEFGAALKIEDRQERERRVDEIKEIFDLNASDYGRKLFLIENCIYGVDIQPVAIQISKLRFFISLIIDQAKQNTIADNFNIRPLPNLETKLVAANTLIALDAGGTRILKPDSVHKLEAELKDVRARIFRARTPATKKRWRTRDQEIRTEIAELLQQSGFAPDAANRLAAWQPFNQDAKADWFDAEWMFGIENGFDIVIGNPPYVRGTKFKEMKNYFKKNFVTAQYQVDLYILFMESGVKSLRKNGTISYITPNSWLKNLMMSDCRKFMLNELHFSSISPNIANAFEAQVDTAILVASRNQSVALTKVVEFQTERFATKKQIDQKRFLKNEKYVFDVEVNDSFFEILKKVKSSEKILGNLADVSFGFRAYDLYSGQTEEVVRTKPFTSKEKESKAFEPYIIGKHINKFSHKTDNILFVNWGSWLAAPREEKYFTGERIVMREILGETLVCTLITEDLKIDRSLYIAKPIDDSYDPRFILALLSSRLMSWFFRHEKNEFDALFPKIRLEEFKKLPIKEASQEKQKPLIELVEKILAAKKADANHDTKDLERQIDELVYQLYDLTADEIRIVEGTSHAAEAQ